MQATINETSVSETKSEDQSTVMEQPPKVEPRQLNRRQQRMIRSLNKKANKAKIKANQRLGKNYSLLQELRDKALKAGNTPVEQVNEAFKLTLKSLFKNDYRQDCEVIERFNRAKKFAKKNPIPLREEPKEVKGDVQSHD